MNKAAIKKFAVRARNKLIADVIQKAYELGITKDEIKEVESFEGGFKIRDLANSKIFKRYETKQREKLISQIKVKGYIQVIEEVAYTWFNRFIALRFMEVNAYLPTGVRVLSSTVEGKTEPDIIKEALNIDLDIDKDLVYRLIDANDTEDLYKYLLIKQCNQLGQIMPLVFQEIADYTELLLPDNLLIEGSVIRDLVDSIEEKDYKDQVEVIGWLYQYYISEKKDAVFAGLKKNKKITKENIPAATQLFTPKWIVKYMMENSLGRLWLESHPDEELKAKWKYYLEEAEQEPEVQKKLDELKNPDLNPEEIKVLDPAMGSGHILVYAFDVLYEIYLKANYSERDIPQLILEKNLYGLDIDDRAGQLAAFALMMKARSKNRRIFRKRIKLNVCAIQESNGLEKEAMEYLVSQKDTGIVEMIHRDEVEYLIDVFKDAKEYGSILEVKKLDFAAIEKRIEEIRNWETADLFELQYRDAILEKIPNLIKQAKIMSEKYDVVCTNPPYMGRKGMNDRIKKYIGEKFTDVKYDLFSAFIERNYNYTKSNGHLGFMTPFVWMFISSYQKLREKMINEKSITSLIQLEYSGFAEATVPICTFTIRNFSIGETGEYIKLSDFRGSENQPIKTLEAIENPNVNYRYSALIKDFIEIPGSPIAYWVSDKLIKVFTKGKLLGEIAKPRQGMATSDNNKFLRLWYEVSKCKIGFGINSLDEAKRSQLKWFPYNKGGDYRKWYGNNDYLVNWHNDGMEIKQYARKLYRNYTRTIKNIDFYFKKCITWSFVSSSKFGVRYCNNGFIFDVAGSSVFLKEEQVNYLLAFLCSKLTFELLKIQNPTLNYQVGNIKQLPIIFTKDHKLNEKISKFAQTNVIISRGDWNSFETSWDFKHHPLLTYSAIKNDFDANNVETAFNRWSDFADEQFNQLKANEEELNRIFIDIYGLQDELTPEVEDKDITISKANRERDIKSFISYAIGCMFGRYSLDEEGLIYAGGEFNISRYKTFIPAKNNILVMADDDYFEDDIVNRFVEFVKVTFGEKTLEENLDYIAETLGNKAKETSRQTIRRYFLKGFYNDHVKTYRKRPIYWLFDSGKENGFKALIYLHRYDTSTVARVRTDYLHKLQKKYEAEVKRLDVLLESDVPVREKAAAKKRKESLKKQIAECLAYDQVIAHVANQKVEIDLDDGVVVNYAKFQGVLVPQGEGKEPLKADLVAKI